MSSEHTSTTSTEAYQETIAGRSPVVDEELVIKKSEHGHKEVIAGIPTPDCSKHRFREELSGDGRDSNIDYPRERDNYTVHRYKLTKNYSGSYYTDVIKRFDISINRDEYPDEADHTESIVDKLSQISVLQSQIESMETFEELKENAEKIRKYEAYYGMLQRIFHQDTLATYATGENKQTPREFKIKQFTQGFYGVPHLFNSHANNIIDDKLKSLEIGQDSVAWGVFIVKPEDFSEIHNTLKPFYHTSE